MGGRPVRSFITLQASTACYRDSFTFVFRCRDPQLGLFHPLEGCVGRSICLASLLLRNPSITVLYETGLPAQYYLHPGGPSFVKISINNFDGSLQAYFLAAPPTKSGWYPVTGM
jgi:hypothetical protein